MNIYFTASLHGKKQYQKHYEKIIDTIESSDNKLLNKSILNRKPEDVKIQSREQAEKYYHQMVNWIRAADIIIAEVSYQSMGVGYEIAMALNEEKPVIALHIPDHSSYLLESIRNERFQMVEYDMDNLTRTVEDALDFAKGQMDVRFNFFVSPRIVNYLDWISKSKKMPRSVYLRRLITKEIRKEKDYQS